MIYFLNCNNFKVPLVGILAGIFSIASGLTCYNCHFNGPDDINIILNVSNAIPPFKNCALNQTGPPYGPAEVCESNELTCAKTRMNMSLVPAGISTGTSPSAFYVSFVLRNCTTAPLPPKGRRCSSFSGDFLTELARLVLYPTQKLTYNISYEGTRCLCGSDLCNSQPGDGINSVFEVNEKEAQTETNQNLSKSNDIQPSIPASAFFVIWCCLLYYFPLLPYPNP